MPSQIVFDLLPQQHNKLSHFITDIMDFFWPHHLSWWSNPHRSHASCFPIKQHQKSHWAHPLHSNGQHAHKPQSELLTLAPTALLYYYLFIYLLIIIYYLLTYHYLFIIYFPHNQSSSPWPPTAPDFPSQRLPSLSHSLPSIPHTLGQLHLHPQNPDSQRQRSPQEPIWRSM